MNRREFIGTAAKAAGVVALTGSVPLVLGRPHYSQVISPFFIEIVKGREERGEMLGDWSADQHLQHLADFIAERPESLPAWRQLGLAL